MDSRSLSLLFPVLVGRWVLYEPCNAPGVGLWQASKSGHSRPTDTVTDYVNASPRWWPVILAEKLRRLRRQREAESSRFGGLVAVAKSAPLMVPTPGLVQHHRWLAQMEPL